MRTLLFIDSLTSGGAQRQIIGLYQALRARGHDVWLTWYHPIDPFLALIDPRWHDQLTCLHKETRSWPRFLLTLRRHLHRIRPDVVVSFLRGPSVLIGLQRLTGGRFAWVIAERSSRIAQDRTRQGQLYRRLLPRADQVVANSWTACDELVALGLHSQRVHRVPNALDRSAPPPDRPEGPLRILMVGAIVGLKNHLRVVEALVRRGGDGWRLDHVGRTLDPALEGRIRRAMAGLGDRIQLHGEQPDVDRFYRQAHLVVHPSDFEGFPNVVLEAWRAGAAVLVSDRGDLPRVVRDGVDGDVFSLDVPGDLDRTLDAALADPCRLKALGAAGRARVEQDFTVASATDAWWRILQQAVA